MQELILGDFILKLKFIYAMYIWFNGKPNLLHFIFKYILQFAFTCVFKCVFVCQNKSNVMKYELRFNAKFVFMWSCISRKCNLCRRDLKNFKMITIDFFMWQRVGILVLLKLRECLLKASSVGDGLYAYACVKLKTSENMKCFKFPSNPAPTLGQKSKFN